MKKSLFILLFLCNFAPLKGQETFGALNSNYSPTNSVHINPTSMLDAKTWLDIHIIGLGSYLNNNIVAAENTTSIRLIRDAQNFDAEDLKYNSGRGKYSFYNRTFVQVLSAVWSQGNHAAGLSFGGYSYTDIRRINDPIVRAIENGSLSLTENPLQGYSLKKFRANNVTYAEAKISYAYTFLKRRRDLFMGGISYKKIFAIGGGGVSIRNLEYNILSDTLLRIGAFQGDAMSFTEPEFSMKGGWGFDLGFTYQRMNSGCESYYPNSKKGGCNRINYKYKIGVSINDLGYVKFNPENLNYAGYQFEETDVLNFANIGVNLDNFPEVIDDIANNPQEDGLIRNPEKMSLPTSISVQYDRNVLPNFVYINATWIHGLRPTKGAFGPRRAHSLAITPRIETKIIDFALPLSLYEYQKLQLGASLRLYFLTIGTDKLLNFIIPSDVYGTDFYFHLKIPLFRNPKCKNAKAFGSNRKGGFGSNMPKCDAYR